MRDLVGELSTDLPELSTDLPDINLSLPNLSISLSWPECVGEISSSVTSPNTADGTRNEPT